MTKGMIYLRNNALLRQPLEPAHIKQRLLGHWGSSPGLATSWHAGKFLNPIRDGAVLPILHLNGYKINNPTLLARIPRAELASLLTGYGWRPHFASSASQRLAVENEIDRFSLAIDAIDRKEQRRDWRIDCVRYAHEYGIDPPELADWQWPF